MKIAHISDIHFFSPSFSPLDIFSKKCIGKCNALLRRRKSFITKHLEEFINSIVNENIDILIITGDFTTTSDKKEFIFAKQFIQKIQKKGIKVFAVPGNHDMYTKKAYAEKDFFVHLNILPKFSNESIHVENIYTNWDLILLDNTINNAPFRANGKFSKEQKLFLKNNLKNKKNIIVASHFSLDLRIPSHMLHGATSLKKILKDHYGISIFMHGHTHKTSYKKESDNMHIFNSSEVTMQKKFKYHMIELNKENFSYKEIQYLK